MKKNPFRIAAERFAEGTNDNKGACEEIYDIAYDNGFDVNEMWDFFANMYRPTIEERLEWNSFAPYWMNSNHQTPEQNRNDRILALLICEQIWEDENKTK